jgi:hypothetical protein
MTAENDATKTKIKISMPGVDIEYEGSQAFVEDKLLTIVERLASVAPQQGAAAVHQNKPGQPSGGTVAEGLSTSTIASKLNVDNGPELIMAAVAKLILVDGLASATRSQLTAEMKSATAYYKATYLNNMSAYLNGLVRKQRLNNVAKDTFSLPVGERQALERTLG